MRPSFPALLALSALLAPTCSSAATLDTFSLTGNGLNLSFNIAAAPQPDSSDRTLGFFVDGVEVLANGTTYTARPADFFLSDVGGGFALQDDDDLIQYFSFSGPQLFTGRVSAPTFTPGTFNVQAVFCPGSDPDNPSQDCTLPTYSLTIAPATTATPEPGSLALLGTGLLSGVAALRRQRRPL